MRTLLEPFTQGTPFEQLVCLLPVDIDAPEVLRPYPSGVSDISTTRLSPLFNLLDALEHNNLNIKHAVNELYVLYNTRQGSRVGCSNLPRPNKRSTIDYILDSWPNHSFYSRLHMTRATFQIVLDAVAPYLRNGAIIRQTSPFFQDTVRVYITQNIE